jgi:hypothetical protein
MLEVPKYKIADEGWVDWMKGMFDYVVFGHQSKSKRYGFGYLFGSAAGFTIGAVAWTVLPPKYFELRKVDSHIGENKRLNLQVIRYLLRIY